VEYEGPDHLRRHLQDEGAEPEPGQQDAARVERRPAGRKQHESDDQPAHLQQPEQPVADHHDANVLGGGGATIVINA
jgi:hypothetical protein